MVASSLTRAMRAPSVVRIDAPARTAPRVFRSHADSYHILGLLAEGGMGNVYLARCEPRRGSPFLSVLKKPNARVASRAELVRLFIDEIRISAALDHPNIARVHGWGAATGSHFMALEYVHGESVERLFQAMRRQGELPPYAVVASIARDIARALHYAHHVAEREGAPLAVVHRDVGPANVIVSPEGIAKLVDFGVARDGTGQDDTGTETIRGRIGSMSPEQLRCEEQIDGRSDQFSLGVMMWELCTDRPLFAATTSLLTYYKVLRTSVSPPSKYANDIPPDLEAIITRTLRGKPEDRYARCADLADDLDAFLLRHGAGDGTKDVAAAVDRAVGRELADRLKRFTALLEPADPGSRGARASGSRCKEMFQGSRPPQTAAAPDDTPQPGGSAPVASRQPTGDTDVAESPCSAGQLGGRNRWVQPYTRSADRTRAVSIVTAGVFVALLVGMWLPELLVSRTVAHALGSLRSQAETQPTMVPTSVLPRLRPVTPHRTNEPSTLLITSTPSGARVTLDGAVKGVTPLRLSPLQGRARHKIAVLSPGHTPWTRSLRLVSGEQRILHAKMTQASPAGRRKR